MITYKVTLSETEVKGIGASRWAARKARTINMLSLAVVLWFIGGLIMGLSVYNDWQAVGYFVLAVIPGASFTYVFVKGQKRAAQNFLEMVKNEQ